MAGILIIAHAPLASALMAVARHVYPDARMEALDVPAAASPAQMESQARIALQRLRDPEALVLTDVFGATPCNIAMRMADVPQVRVLTGVNVPMLWRALCYQTLALDALAERSLDGARNGVLPVSAPGPQNQAARTVDHAQDHSEHQQ